jgi:hypothetical protein
MTFEATGTGRYIDGVLFECLQGHDLQSPLVGGSQHHVGGSPVVVGPQPIHSCHPPAVPGYQAGEPVLEHRGAQIVAHLLLVLEELSSHHRSDGVAAPVLGTGMAAAVSKETGDRVIAEGLQPATQHVAISHLRSICHDLRSGSVEVKSGAPDRPLQPVELPSRRAKPESGTLLP